MITYSAKKYNDLLHLRYLESLSALGLGDKVDEVTYLLQNINNYVDDDCYKTDVNEVANKKNPEYKFFTEEYTNEDGTINVDVNPLGGGYYYMEFVIIDGVHDKSAEHESFVTKDEIESLIKIFKLKKTDENE